MQRTEKVALKASDRMITFRSKDSDTSLTAVHVLNLLQQVERAIKTVIHHWTIATSMGFAKSLH